MTVDSRPGRILSTSEVGAILWLELAEGAARDALVERLAQAHLIDADGAAEELDSFPAKVHDRELPEA